MANGQFLHRIKALACGAILVFMAAGDVNAWAGGADKHAISSVLAAPVTQQKPLARAESDIRLAYTRSPLSFEVNHGQTDAEVKFLARGRGYTLFLTATEAVLRLRASHRDKDSAAEATEAAVLRLQFLGANPTPTVFGQERRVAQANYFRGNDSKRWSTHVPLYARVRYENLYPGIDLVYYGNQQRLEYDFVLAPGADPERIRLRYAGVDRLRLDADGNLILRVAGREVLQRTPVIYQDIDGQRQAIAGNYVITGTNQVGFALARYDAGQPLIIDPILEYSTYLGGSGTDWGHDIAVDASGNVYVTGRTRSLDFPLANPLQSTHAGLDERWGGDVFISKFDPSGRSLIYSTYLGGSSGEEAWGIAIDADGNAYIAGVTRSGDFPTVNPYQPVIAGELDVFIAKLNAAGSALVYSTYLGGSGSEGSRGITVDTDGNAILTGYTSSPDFPMASPIQAVLAGNQDAFVTKLDASGTLLVYSTYLGGNRLWRGTEIGTNMGRDIAVDTDGNAYVTGSTNSPDFPTVGPIQVSHGGDYYDDAFVAKINAAGSMLVYSTYLGGSSHDFGLSIAVDGGGNAYVTGYTESPDFPTLNPIEGLSDVTPPSYRRGSIFVTKVDAAGSALAYSSLLVNGWGRGIAVDAAGSAYVTGLTQSLDFPLASPFFQLRFAGGEYDAFVLKVNPAGSALVYSSYLGGQWYDVGTSIAVDAAGSAYVTGTTSSNDFPTVNALQSSRADSSDAFVTKVKLDPTTSADLSISMTQSPEPAIAGDDLTYSLSVTNNGPDDATEVLVTDVLSVNATFVSATPSQGTCSGSRTISCQLGTLINGAGATVDIVVTPNAVRTLGNLAYVTSAVTDPDSSNNVVEQSTAVFLASDLAVSMTANQDPVAVGYPLTYTITVTWQGPPATNVVLTNTLPSSATLSSASASQGSCSGASAITCSLGTMNSGTSARVTIVVIPNEVGTLTNAASVTSDANDSVSGNNSAQTTTTVSLPTADLAITKTNHWWLNHGWVRIGNEMTYDISVTNRGPIDADAVVVTDPLPSNVTFVSARGNCTSSGGTVTCNLGTVHNGASLGLSITVIPTQLGELSNTARVTSNTPDPNASNNSATATTTVEPYGSGESGGSFEERLACTVIFPFCLLEDIGLLEDSGGGGGGGCTLNPDAGFDPLLPLLVVLSGLYLLRRRVNMH